MSDKTIVKPAFLAGLVSPADSAGGGNDRRKPKWKGIASKSLFHAIAGLAVHAETGAVILWDNPVPAKLRLHLSREAAERVFRSLHPEPFKGADPLKKATLDGWYAVGRKNQGGASKLGLIHPNKWTDEAKQTVLHAVCKAMGADPKNIAPAYKVS